MKHSFRGAEGIASEEAGDLRPLASLAFCLSGICCEGEQESRLGTLTGLVGAMFLQHCIPRTALDVVGRTKALEPDKDLDSRSRLLCFQL